MATTTLRDFLIVYFYHQKVAVSILALSLVVAVAGWALSPVRYTAKEQLLVLFGREQSGAQGLFQPSIVSVDGVRATLSEVEFLRDRAVLRRVAEQIGPARIVPRLGQRRYFGLWPAISTDRSVEAAVDELDRWLKITVPQDANLVVVSFQHEDRELAIEIVNTLVNVYLQRRGEVYNMPRSPLLKERAQVYADKLAQIEAQLAAEKARLNVVNLDQEILLALNQVDSTEQSLNQQKARREAIGAEMKATAKLLTELPNRVFDFREKTDRVDNDDTDNLLTKLYLERRKLEEEFQANDPRTRSVLRDITVLEDLRRQARRNFTTEREVRNPAADFVTNHLSQMRVEHQALSQSLTELEHQLADNRRRVDALRAGEQGLKALERSHQMVEQLYREVNQQAEAAQLEEAAAAARSANVRIVNFADASLEGSSNGLNVALGCLAGGLILSTAITLLAAWNRNVLLLPKEVETALGLPLLATYNQGQDFGAQAAQAQTIYLAGQLAFAQTGEEAIRRVQVISLAEDEQRSDFVAALAGELAAGQNLRVLLVDLTAGGEHHWRAFGSPPPGEDKLAGLTVAATPLPRLDVTLGLAEDSTGAGGHWLRTDGQSLGDMFEALASRYDMVMIDAPAARDSLTALRLATVVDGSVLVIRAEHTRVPATQHICGQILGAGGDLFGAVVTGRKFRIPEVIYRWF